MAVKLKTYGVIASAAAAAAFAIVPSSSTSAATPPNYDPDPAHHSTDINDGDPAHHRANWVFSASTNEWKLVPVAGFDLNGNRLGSGGGGSAPTGDTDPAHHSLDVNDPDPAHHRPVLVCEGSECRLVPLPGFDINGYALPSAARSGSYFS